MTTIKSSLLELKRNDANFADECRKIANDISQKNKNLLDVVLELGPFFNSHQQEEREEGIHVLSTIISFLSINALQKNEILHLCNFYKGRLNDHYKMIPTVLTGILSLSNYDQTREGHIFTGILTTMFQTVSCQAQPSQDRLKIYHIYRNMLRHQPAELLDLGPDFVYGVISAIDGERDPQNLIFLFEWLPEFISTVKLGHLVEEMYDVLSCYFPVDFRVPAQDAKGISREALAQALTPCLCATNAFAEQSIQLALEKLDSDLLIAKHDSLQLLLLGCKKFTIDVFIQYKTGIWTTLQKELLKRPSPEIEALLLQTTTEISRKISMDDPNFIDLFEKLLETNMGNLDTAGKFFTPTWKLFLAMSKANEKCAQRVLPNIQPCLLTLFDISSNITHKTTLLNILTDFIQVGDEFNANIQEIPHFLLTLLVKNDKVLRAIALDALRFVNQQFDVIKLMLLEQWGRLFAEKTSKEVQAAFHRNILHYTSKCEPEIILLIKNQSSNCFGALFDDLSELCSREPYISEFCNYFIKFINIQTNVCLAQLNKALKLHRNEVFYQKMSESNIIEYILYCKHDNDLQIEDFVNIMECLMQIIGFYNPNQQEVFLEQHLEAILDQFRQETGDGHEINDKNKMDTGEVELKSIYILSGILTCLHLENVKDFGIIDDLFMLGCHGNQAAVELVANLVNKLPNGIIEPLLEGFAGVLSEIGQDSEEMVDNYGIVVIWLTKALFMRGYAEKSRWIQLIMEYLQHTKVIANGMKTIMSDDFKSLSMDSHCRRRLLYKQQFFIEICQIFEGKATNNDILVFASLLKEVPSVILKMNFEKLIRLIMMCLDNSTDATGILPILTTIKNLLESGDALSEQYLEDFLPRLLKLSEFVSSMNVRIFALQCLRLYVNDAVPMHKLMKHKNMVTDALGKCIDDKKRLVRKEATNARMKWFLLGAPI